MWITIPSCTVVGAKPDHNDNHYGTSAIVSALKNIASSYSGSHKAVSLRFNDMIL